MDPDLFTKVNVSYTVSMKRLPKYIPLLNWQKTDEISAVDIGCGNGRITWEILRPLLPKGIKLFGSDVEPKMLKFIADKYPDLKTFELDISTENVPEHLNESFDYIFSFYTLMRVRDITKAFQNIYDMLKPGGQFFTYYTCSHIFFDILFKLSKTDKWRNYIPNVKEIFSYYEFDDINSEDVRKMIEDIGFKISIFKIEFKNNVLPTFEDLKIFFIGVCPDYLKVPPNLRTDFVNDALEMLFQHNIWIRENQDNSGNFLVPSNLITIQATK